MTSFEGKESSSIREECHGATVIKISLCEGRAVTKFAGNPDPKNDARIEQLAYLSLLPDSHLRPGCAAVIAPGEWIDSAGNVRRVTALSEYAEVGQ